MSLPRLDSLSLQSVREMFRQHGVTTVLMKALSPNDNSKNQPYFGGDFSLLNLLPVEKPIAVRSLSKRGVRKRIFKASMNFAWLGGDGTLAQAPNAKLILYPQYPEVRFSGYLLRTRKTHRPSDILGNVRTKGRYLVLGVASQGQVIGAAASPGSRLARELGRLRGLEQAGVFVRIPLDAADTEEGRQALLLSEICRISKRGWIDSKRLNPSKHVVSCSAPNCGGYTLEAELGITPNGKSEPDFHGWEVKQHAVKNFARHSDSVITLMTPEPTGGFYARHGVIAFVEKYGYADRKGRANRRNFGGVHRRGVVTVRTQLRLELVGYDATKRKILDPAGGIALVDRAGVKAAFWRFGDILDHWSRKHAFAAYVPSITRNSPHRQYQYASRVRLARGTTVELFLAALHDGDVYYDPGIKVEGSPHSQRYKKRSQFRVKSSRLARLYSQIAEVDSCSSKQPPD